MTTNNNSSVKEIILCPQNFYNKPREIISDPSLTAKEKEKVLDSWELEEKALLEADDENMAKEGGKDDKAEVYLQEISKVRTILKNEAKH